MKHTSVAHMMGGPACSFGWVIYEVGDTCCTAWMSQTRAILTWSKPGGSPIFKIVSSTPRKTASDDFLNSDSEKNDYDWLLTPPGTPLFPSLEMESNKSTLGQIVTPKARPTALKSRATVLFFNLVMV
ncbi:uncharacterized protein LOC131252554 isoform X3 [Magnolia sinica]|uniref:uncharacterized protein LOC131252554 isoform X3 n=1 Tax=Magnolia sinica TaxID=86752 RepID=UPI0026586C07|nr:uncharacterized protein LOC131252554 isoform X3 [Magnolia sinica]